MDAEETRRRGLRQGHRTAFAATAATLVLALTKATVGLLFEVEMLVADALHSGADLLAIFASGFGLWLATRRKSARFPYGLYRAETVASLLIGIGILWAGVELFREGLAELFSTPVVRSFPVIPAVAAGISVVVAFVLARLEKKVGRRINSQSLIINARESFLDIFVSAMVLLGILLDYFRIPYVEGGVILGISVLVFWLGARGAWTSLLMLMDASMEPNLQVEISEKVNEIYGVKGVGDVKIRQSGPFRMVECRIETSPTLPLYRAHELADKVEDFIADRYTNIESVFVHVEPAREKVMTAIVPVRDIRNLDSRVHGHFGRSPYFIILKIQEGKAEIEDFYMNPYLKDKIHVGIKVIKAVIRYKLDILFTPQIGELSFYMLKENFVDIYRAEEGESVRDLLQRFLTQSLTPVAAPTHKLEDSATEGVD